MKKYNLKYSLNLNKNKEKIRKLISDLKENKKHNILIKNSGKTNIKSNFIPKNNKNFLTISHNNTIHNNLLKSRAKSSKFINFKTYLPSKTSPFKNYHNFCETNANLSKKNRQNNIMAINNKKNNTITYDNHQHNHNHILFPKNNTNYINYVDRNIIRNIDLTSLKYFDNYIDEHNLSYLSNNNNKKNNLIRTLTQNYARRETFIYKDFKKNYTKTNFFNSISNAINIDDHINNRLSSLEKMHFNNEETNNYYNFDFLLKTKKKYKSKRKKYSLKELMELNPYHYVSNIVKYSNSIQMKKISETLGNIHGAHFNIKAKSQRHFFRGQSFKNKHSKSENKYKNKRLINSFQVIFNSNISHKSGLVWRILQKFKKKRNNINPSFRQACKFKAYFELWKYHSMMIEKLLVNYNKFKWFFEKEKFITKEVFNEFLVCKKLEEEMKGEISFVDKVYLAFDDHGYEEINIKTFYLIMEITSKSNNSFEKINFITKILEDYNYIDEEKSVNLYDMYELFKCIIVNDNATKDVRYLYESIKEDLNKGEKIDNNIYVSKDDVYDFLLKNKFIHKLIQTFNIQYKYANVNYVEEINSCFNSTVRNVKKFLNEQNEVICDTKNKYYKFEEILKSIHNKMVKKEKTKKIEDEFENEKIEEEENYQNYDNDED